MKCIVETDEEDPWIQTWECSTNHPSTLSYQLNVTMNQRSNNRCPPLSGYTVSHTPGVRRPGYKASVFRASASTLKQHKGNTVDPTLVCCDSLV